ncbi:MAG: glycogen synthase GlgA [Nitrosomonadales bacterium]|nr:glycogen synthase GlgA [Nitrosomonadales bacterium]
MRVLFATSEAVPLIKTGGLADVSAALPAALHGMGVDVRLLLPAYPQVLKALPHLETATELSLFGFPAARLLAGRLPDGMPLWVIDCPELYLRGGGPYQDEHGMNWMDNAHRFGLLSRIAAVLGSAESPLGWKPDVVHCNDWQTALAPAYLNFSDNAAPSVMAIHNIAFQGIFPPQTTLELGLPAESFQMEGLEFYGNLSFLKAGLHYSDHITTVSPSYAEEIQTDALGFGLQGLLASRRKDLTGILNGIDTDEWNPAADPSLAQPYDATDLRGKTANKLELQRRMGLQTDPEAPLFGLVSRFTHQKGLDMVLEIAAQLVALPAQLVLLGAGDAGMQRAALELSHRHSGQIGAYVGFDEDLSHLIEAGADIFMMPSRFEPCGLNQMFSQRYGTPPVVHATGGLVDTVVDCSAESLERGDASGFKFYDVSAASLLAAAQRAVAAYHDKEVWKKLQLNGMSKDFGWGKSAAAYRDIYARLMRQ